MARWVYVGVSSPMGKACADLDKALAVAALEDPNVPGSYVVAAWFNTYPSTMDQWGYQTIVGSYTTLADAEVALQKLLQGYDPTA